MIGDTIISRIKIMRMTKDKFRNLSDGEFAFSTDTKELFIGYDEEAIPIATQPLINKFKTDIEHIKNDVHYFHEREKDLIYNIQIGGDNLITNGNFYIPLDEAKNIGMNLIGDTNDGVEIFYEDVSDLGIGNDKCLTIINRKPGNTSGVNFSIIDLNRSVDSIDRNCILQFWSRYQFIIPGEDIHENLCRLGEVKIIYEYSDGTSTIETFNGEVIYTGSKGWHKNVFKFKIKSEKQIVRAFASVYFYFQEAVGDISISGVKVEYGDVATGTHMSDKDILYISKCLDKRISEAILNSEKHIKKLEVETNKKIDGINKNIARIDKDIDLINNRIANVDYIPKNRLRNTGEFTNTLYWQSSNRYFTFEVKNNLMNIKNKTNTISHIDIMTAESMYMDKPITISIIFKDNRNDIDKDLDIRLRDRNKDIYTIKKYTIEKYDADMKKYVAIIEPQNDIKNAIEYVAIYNLDFLINDEIDIKNLKMSYYIRDTEWYPCPEDTVYSFNNYTTDINGLQDSLKKITDTLSGHTSNITKIFSILGTSKINNDIVTEKNLTNIPFASFVEDKTVVEILNDMLYKDKSPELTDIEIYDDDGNQITSYNQKGEYIYVHDVVLRYIGYRVPIRGVKLYIGNNMYECTVEDLEDYAIYRFGGNIRLGETTKFKCVLTTMENVSFELSKTINFVPPVYYGSTDKSIAEIDQVYILKGNVLPVTYDMDKVSLTFNHDHSKAYACIPDVLMASLYAIKDKNSINYLDAFDIKPIMMLFDGVNRHYTLYVMKHRTEMHNTVLDFVKKDGV